MRAVEQDRASVRGRVFGRLVAIIQRNAVGRQTRAQRKMVLRQVVHESRLLQLAFEHFATDDGGCRLNRLRQVIVHHDM